MEENQTKAGSPSLVVWSWGLQKLKFQFYLERGDDNMSSWTRWLQEHRVAMKNCSAGCVKCCDSVSHNAGGGCGNASDMVVVLKKILLLVVMMVVVEMKKMVVMMDMLMMVECS